MSQQPGRRRDESRPNENQPSQARQNEQTHLVPPQSQGDRPLSPRAQDIEVARSYGGALPPLTSLTGTTQSSIERRDPNPPRPSGVHAILNPTHSTTGEQVSRFAQSHAGGGATEHTTQYPQVPSVTYPGQYHGEHVDPTRQMQPLMQSEVYGHRHMSPTVFGTERRSSHHGLREPMQSPSRSPFSEHRRTDPNVPSVLPVTTPSTTTGQTYSTIPRNNPYPMQSRAQVASQAPLQARSLSASPSTSYSSYSQPSQTSPVDPIGIQPGSRKPSYTLPPTQPPTMAPASSAMSMSEVERPYPSASSAVPQSTYQLITRDTEHGPVQFTVEVASGSRVADEKRRRNAGASARFRARRKEKEKEASSRISDLQQRIQDLSQDAEYYRKERDYFATLVFNAPERDRHFPRPPSPRYQRLQQPQAAAVPQGYSVLQESGESTSEGRHSKRRLTGYASQPNLLQASRLAQQAPPLPPYPLMPRPQEQQPHPAGSPQQGTQHVHQVSQAEYQMPASLATLPWPQSRSVSGPIPQQQRDPRERHDHGSQGRDRQPPSSSSDRR